MNRIWVDRCNVTLHSMSVNTHMMHTSIKFRYTTSIASLCIMHPIPHICILAIELHVKTWKSLIKSTNHVIGILLNALITSPTLCLHDCCCHPRNTYCCPPGCCSCFLIPTDSPPAFVVSLIMFPAAFPKSAHLGTTT